MHDQPLLPVSGQQRLVALCMAAAVLLMFATAIGYRFLHPEVLKPVPVPRETSAPQEDSERMMAGVSLLMQRLQANPQDAAALIGLSEHFLHLEDWAPAEQFARRAAAAAPNDMKPHYLLSVALHGQNRNEEAAASLEQALALKDEPALRYSLGILYAYYLKDKGKAADQFRLGLAAPALPAPLKKDLEEELAKLAQ